MTPNPILKVLSTLGSHRARHLLMGGQACVLYGAAEFSRDTDVVVLAETGNLDRLTGALEELRAGCIAVPPFEMDYLLRGHAVHFRCQHPDALRMRIDVMAVLRGVAPFDVLWERRMTMRDESGVLVEIIGLADLVTAKKTQRDKDWPMIRRLIETHFVENRANPTPEQIDFWLCESRTASMLIDLADRFPDGTSEASKRRPLLTCATTRDQAALERMLQEEEDQQRQADRAYWAPLRAELEQLRHEDKRP